MDLEKIYKKFNELQISDSQIIHKLEDAVKIFSFYSLTIYVYSNEGPIPHFHFEDNQSNNFGCLRLDTNEYFYHGKYKGQLNKKQLKKLQEMLNSQLSEKYKRLYSKMDLKNNYEFMCLIWNTNNDVEFNFSKDIPDYTIL